MNEAQRREFVKKVVSSAELGSDNPYKAYFSTGESGLSFGIMQLDVGHNDGAKAVFRKILNAEVASGAISQVLANDIYSKASNAFV